MKEKKVNILKVKFIKDNDVKMLFILLILIVLDVLKI